MTTYTETCTQGIHGISVNTLSSLVQRLQRWARIQQLKFSVHRERQQLLEMSDAMLADLGITRGQAQEEARRVDLPVMRIDLQAGKRVD